MIHCPGDLDSVTVSFEISEVATIIATAYLPACLVAVHRKILSCRVSEKPSHRSDLPAPQLSEVCVTEAFSQMIREQLWSLFVELLLLQLSLYLACGRYHGKGIVGLLASIACTNSKETHERHGTEVLGGNRKRLSVMIVLGHHKQNAVFCRLKIGCQPSQPRMISRVLRVT